MKNTQGTYAASVLLVALSVFAFSSAKPQCLDLDGNPVEWWFAYKLPRVDGPVPGSSDGTGYVYYDESHSGLVAAPSSMDDSSGGAVQLTLQQLYGNAGVLFHASNHTREHLFETLHKKRVSGSDGLSYFMYNDEKPDGSKSGTRGHAKGVVVSDVDAGFWLVHSIPQFPPKRSDGYSYPDTGTIFAQSMLCMSMTASELEKATTILALTNPYIYDCDITSGLDTLSSLCSGSGVEHSPTALSVQPSLVDGKEMMLMSKTREWGRNFYPDYLAPTLSTNVVLETWCRPCLPSACSPSVTYDAMNNLDIKLPTDKGDISFKETQDHAKIAIADASAGENSESWVCVGDLNHMESQSSRGGGTSCLRDDKLHSILTDAFYNLQPCSSTSLYKQHG